jgi:hypothetical protein
VYTTVAYGYQERTHIIPKQTKDKMPYLKRFIYDMLGIWCGSDADWIIFKASLNGFGILKWRQNDHLLFYTEEPSRGFDKDFIVGTRR